MGTLGHVLEAAGLATVGLSLVRGQIERVAPPRALHCEFPLGRPLGRPADPDFQRRVLVAALDLLQRDAGPVLEDFPDTIDDVADEPLACALPPRLDPDLHPAVDEAVALRPAYDRQLAASGGRTIVGRVVDNADAIPELVAAFTRIADGASLEEAGIGGVPHEAALDIRAYYEEAALALTDHVPEARAAEAWLYRQTETGRVLHRAQAALRDADAPFQVWFYLVPVSQQGASP